MALLASSTLSWSGAMLYVVWYDSAGVINRKDVDELLFTDSVDEAFDHIVQAIGSIHESPK